MHDNPKLRVLLKDKSEKHFLIRFVTSTFFLGLISTALAGALTTYFAVHKECIAEAEKLIERQKHLSSEILSRQLGYVSFVNGLTSWKDIQGGPAFWGSLHSEFSTTPFVDLQLEQRQLSNRMTGAELSVPEFREAGDRWMNFVGELGKKMREAQTKVSSKLPTLQSDQNTLLTLTKQINLVMGSVVTFQSDALRLTTLYGPHCTALNTLRTAIGQKPPIIEVSLNPELSSEEVKEKLKWDIKSGDRLIEGVAAANKANHF